MQITCLSGCHYMIEREGLESVSQSEKYGTPRFRTPDCRAMENYFDKYPS